MRISKPSRAVLLGAMVLLSQKSYGQTARALAQTGTKSLEFEVASVRPADLGVRISNVLSGADESLTIQNVPLRNHPERIRHTRLPVGRRARLGEQ